MDTETRYLITDQFILDRQNETLEVQGRVVPLHRRSFQVLELLMMRPGELITKRTLFEEIWGSLDVSDAVLTTAIKEIRQALGDDARAPWAISTVHARGYRLLVSVRTSAAKETPVPSGQNSDRTKKTSKWVWPLFAAVAFVIVLLLLIDPSGQSSDESDQSGQKSIAVLPFEDLSENGGYEWFAEGLSEEILNSLAQSKELLVAARTSSFRYESGSGVDVREVGKALNVSHIMEGSVRRGNDHLRVTAQLIRADDGFHVWSQTYDTPIATEDALSLQKNIAEDVFSTLLVINDDNKEVDAIASVPFDLFENYLRGRQLVMARQEESVLEGLNVLNNLVREAPEYAPGHAWLAYAYMFSTEYSDRPMGETSVSAEIHVRRALALDPDGADPLTAAAMLELFRRDLDSALEYANRAVAANPNHVPALRRRGVVYINLGMVRKAHEDFLAVRARDPLSPISLAHVSDTYTILNDAGQAFQAAQEAVRWNPHDAIAHGNLGRVLSRSGRYVESIRHFERSMELNPNAFLTSLGLASLYWKVGFDERLDFAPEDRIWTGLAAAAFSAGNFEQGLDLAERYGIGGSGSLTGMHIFHWWGDAERAYPYAMRFSSRDRLDGSGLDENYRRAAIPVMLALEANNDPQAEKIRKNLSRLFDNRQPGDFEFGSDIYGIASWKMVNQRKEDAYLWLEDAVDKGFIYRSLHLDPIWDEIRNEARFQEIVTTMDQQAAEVRKQVAESSSGEMSS